MPELPEVKTVVKHLKKNLLNLKIIEVVIYKDKLIKNSLPEDFINNLIDQKIQDIQNYGKFIVFHFENNLIMLSHLRMEGKYRLEKEITNLKKHDYILFKLSNNKWLIYNDSRQFGTFHLKNKDNYLTSAPLNKIADEPNKIKIDVIAKKLINKNLAIKSALLDQTIICGLGNIYVNEVLWETKVNPKTPAKKISKEKLAEILITSQNILDKATKWGGSTLHSFQSFGGEIGRYQQFLNVHQKVNKSCKRCTTIIVKERINGRGTYYCPNCQN